MSIALALFFGCTSTEGFERNGEPQPANPSHQRTPPQVLMPEATGVNQVAKTSEDGQRSAAIDMSNASKGYVAVQCQAPTHARIRVIKGDENSTDIDNYLLGNDGGTSYYPLTKGNGSYTVIVYIFVANTDAGPNYAKFLVGSVDVQLESEFAPYLLPNRIVNYTPQSACVAFSHQLTKNCGNELEVVQQVYYWIANNISYDVPKAEEVSTSGVEYEPDPDTIFQQRAGICYDYASLAAAMLRANAIPTILVKGEVKTPEGEYLYHAWNLVWIKDVGWIAVKMEVDANNWNRIDLTFASSGDSNIASFVGDGQNYTDMSYH